MSAQLGNIVFIVWRESVEALLVVGILSAWLATRDPVERRAGRLHLWAGVGCGIAGAIGLAWGLTRFDEALPDGAQQIFQVAMVLVAAGLIVQMVAWMRRNGRTLKRDMETALSGAADRRSWWGVFILAMLAVLREGSETVVFLWGTLSGLGVSTFLPPLSAALLGFGAAIVTYLLLQLGGRVLSWRSFFRVTEVMLLCLAAALIVTGIDGMMDLGWLPTLGRAWDTSAIVADNGIGGGLLAALTGYRARPDLTEVLGFALFWAGIAWMMLRDAPRSAVRPA
jgi:high-affinity iron transporter